MVEKPKSDEKQPSSITVLPVVKLLRKLYIYGHIIMIIFRYFNVRVSYLRLAAEYVI